MKVTTLTLIAAALLGHALAASAQSKTLVFCTEASPEGFDSARHVTVPTFNASAEPLYNKLVTFDTGSTKVIPDLAERWSVSADGLTYTFHLRSGVKWHSTEAFKPSRDFDADDVVFSLNRYRHSDLPFNKAYGVTDYPYNKTYAGNIKALDKVDARTVRVTLAAPDASFLPSLAMTTSIMVSAEYADRLLRENKAADIDHQPVGTGPFVLRRYEKDSQIRYDAHPAYWGGRSKVDRLVYVIVKDSAVRLQKLKAGECHVSVSPKPQELAAIKADPQLALQEVEGLNIGYIGFNTEKRPFDNRDVRLALAMAIDKKALLEALYQGTAVTAAGLLPPNVFGYTKDVKDVVYSPEEAKKLLARAGFPNGFETDLWAMPISRAYNPDARKMAEMVQADWARIGVKVRIVSYEWGEYIKRVRAGEHQVATLGWTSDNGDPDNFFSPLVTCARPTVSRWCPKPMTDLLDKARVSTDAGERARLYREAQLMYREEMPMVPIAHAKMFQPLRKDVSGFKISPLTRTVLYGVEAK